MNNYHIIRSASIHDNLFTGTEYDSDQKFWVWINSSDPKTKHNVKVMRSITSVWDNADGNLQFVLNPKFNGITSPFQANVLWQYYPEYCLEESRKRHFQEYPSRLCATFLFESEHDARQYKESHLWHVSERDLWKTKPKRFYKYSKHDSNWIDFLRNPYSKHPDTVDKIAKAYWNGATTEDYPDLAPKDDSWTKSSVAEILYAGTIALEEKIDLDPSS